MKNKMILMFKSYNYNNKITKDVLCTSLRFLLYNQFNLYNHSLNKKNKAKINKILANRLCRLERLTKKMLMLTTFLLKVIRRCNKLKKL